MIVGSREEVLSRAKALLEPHRKVATCIRAAGESRESMVNFDAAVELLAFAMYDEKWDRSL